MKTHNYKKDILSGIIVALISIPIAMGYSQVAGLPVVYGLYGSVLPVIIFGFISSSPQFVFGVDAAPAALAGGVLATLGVGMGSDEAMSVIPVITFVTACWLLLFSALKLGKLVIYISKPVLSGFITGIGTTIIMMQIPKLFGGSSGTGEIFDLIKHIYEEAGTFHLLSFAMGFGTVIILQISRKLFPKFPMQVVMLVAGALSSMVFHVEKYGVKLLPQVAAGIPKLKKLDFSILVDEPALIIVESATIALVIVSSTLLTANNYAIKNDYKIKNNREIFAYSAANFTASAFGCCPLNGSVSRTAIGEQYGAKSQIMSISSGITMLLVLLFGTKYIAYLPVPVLTGIVMSALIGILQFKVARALWNTDRTECFIFLGAFAGVLVLGTIYGVVVGVVLSFIQVIRKAAQPPRNLRGVIPGQSGFYSLERNKNAHKIKDTVIYQFSNALFFANIDIFENDIEAAIDENTKVVIVDASGIGSVDITAAERLMLFADKMAKRNISFFITEHNGSVNDDFRQLGASRLIDEGVVRRTITLALREAGIEKPYPLEDREGVSVQDVVLENNEELAELEWAFGKDADAKMEEFAKAFMREMAENKTMSEASIKEAEENNDWGRIGLFDENELLDRVEMHLPELVESGYANTSLLEKAIEERRIRVERKLYKLHPEALNELLEHRKKEERILKKMNPQAYAHIVELRKEHINKLKKVDPMLAQKLEELIETQDN